MATQITRKSSSDAPGAARPAPAAQSLAEARRPPYAPSHGSSPEPFPEPPVGLFDLGPAQAFRVIGPDRESWLQGMVTADVLAVPVGGAAYGAFLGGKGRLVSDGLVWRREAEMVVTVPGGRLEPLLAHLDRLLIMEDAELLPAPGLRRLRWYPGGIAVESALTGSWQGEGFELLLAEDEAGRLLESLPARPATEAVEQLRVALGVPLWGRELDEETVPLEGGLDRGISFDKGCYVGQEVVAMATFRGRVSWNLVRLQVAGAPPAPGTLLDPPRAGRRGRVTSAVALPGGGAAALLGYVHKELIAPGGQVALEDGRAATVLGLPFGSRPGAGVCA